MQTLSSIRFGAWQQPGAMASIQQKGAALETQLESPLVLPTPLTELAEQYREPVGKLKARLKSLSQCESIGMGEVRQMFATLTQSGYSLPADEQAIFDRQLRNQGNSLSQHVSYFPKSGHYDYENLRCSQPELSTLVCAWLKVENMYGAILEMANAIDKSVGFQGDATLQAALQNRLDQLQTNFSDPVVRQAYLKSYMSRWQPKSQSDLHVDLMLNTLVPDLVGDGTGTAIDLLATSIRDQAKAIVGERNMKIQHASRTQGGLVYVLTQSTQAGSQMKAFLGVPGDLQPHTVTHTSSKNNTEIFTLDNGSKIKITRRPSEDEDSDALIWEAAVNDDPATREFDPKNLPDWNPVVSG